MGKRNGAYRILMGKHDGKLSFGNLDVRGDHVKMDLKEIVLEIPDCTDLAQIERQLAAAANAVLNLKVL
jgi:hypothetical protein